MQQLAHLGFKDYILYDADRVEETNLNRLVGGTSDDALNGRLKIEVAERVIRSLHADAIIEAYPHKWQEDNMPLKAANLIFGCVDGFAERRELETCARRFLIPLIDIGIDVSVAAYEPPQLAGQIILSLPDAPCMQCLEFLGQRQLAVEAQKYGQAGDRPQVIWANGVVASTAVGIAIDLITNWTTLRQRIVYLSYYGNKGTIEPHIRLRYMDIKSECPHYRSDLVGEPNFMHV